MTIGLAIISKTPEEASELITQAYPYVDKIYLQINGGIDIGGYRAGADPKIEVSSFKWKNDFAAARNALHKHIKTDYWMWADTDDTLAGLDNLPKILEFMDSNHIDVWYAPYEYAYDEHGDVITRQYRERILRNYIPVKWKGAVHETIIPTKEFEPLVHRSDSLVWQHIKTEAETEASTKRNHKILLKEWKREQDPRTAYYLGMSFFGLKDWANARKYFAELIKASGWTEERYRAWLKIAESHGFEGNTDKQIGSYMMAQKEMPERPDSYLGLADAHFDLEEFEKCLEYIEMAYDKKLPKTNAVSDPTVYTYRSLMMKALALFQLNRIEDAYLTAKQVGKIQPEYAIFKQAFPTFEEAYYQNEAIKKLKWIVSYLHDNKGNTRKLFESLPSEIAFNPALAPERAKAYPPKTWPEKSVVIYCGQSPELWGPDTLGDGMGGSEEAVVYLSRELNYLGYKVTVYNQREDEYDDKGVTYLPWHSFNPADKFDTFVAWRNPSLNQHIKANVRLLDMHDTPVGHQEVSEEDLAHIDKVMLKSQYQADMAPILKGKYFVVGNGIVREQFE